MYNGTKLKSFCFVLVMTLFLKGIATNGLPQPGQLSTGLILDHKTIMADSNTTVLGIWENDIILNSVDIFIEENNLFLLNKDDGLYVIDVSDPEAPFIKGSCILTSDSRCMVIDGSYAYVGNDGLKIINIEDPTNPYKTGHCNTNGARELDIAVAADFAYVTAGSHMYIIDISDETNPVLIGDYDAGAGRYMTAIDIRGSYAFVGMDYSWQDLVQREFRVIDISVSTNPIEAGRYDGWWGYTSLPAQHRKITAIAAKDSNLFVINAFMGLGIFNISNPTEPAEVGFYRDIRGSAYDVSIDGNYAYLSDYDCKVIQIFNPGSPSLDAYAELEYDHYYTPENTTRDGIVYVAAEKLFIIENEKVSDIDEIANQPAGPLIVERIYPNPFESLFKIEFSVTKNCDISINILNLKRQTLMTVLDDFFIVGSHEVDVNKVSFSPGVYIISLETDTRSVMKKVILLK